MARRHSAPRPRGVSKPQAPRRGKKTLELPATSNRVTGHRRKPLRLFYDLEPRLAAVGRGGGRARLGGGRIGSGRQLGRRLAREDEPLPVFLREDAGDRFERDGAFARHAVEARGELDQFVSYGE